MSPTQMHSALCSADSVTVYKKVLQDGTKMEYTYIRFCRQCLRYIQGFDGCI